MTTERGRSIIDHGESARLPEVTVMFPWEDKAPRSLKEKLFPVLVRRRRAKEVRAFRAFEQSVTKAAKESNVVVCIEVKSKTDMRYADPAMQRIRTRFEAQLSLRNRNANGSPTKEVSKAVTMHLPTVFYERPLFGKVRGGEYRPDLEGHDVGLDARAYDMGVAIRGRMEALLNPTREKDREEDPSKDVKIPVFLVSNDNTRQYPNTMSPDQYAELLRRDSRR